MTVWLLISVGCAECSGGDMPLTTAIGTFLSEETAKMASGVAASQWNRREDSNGYWTYSGHGAWEIHPIEIDIEVTTS